MRGNIPIGSRRGIILVASCLLLGGCNDPISQASAQTTQTSAGSAFDSSRLPRVTGAKEVFASPAVTNFTSPDPVPQTAETLTKALAAGGWQAYEAPSTARANDQTMRIMSLKKGSQALNVFISMAPAQNNATMVQYSELPLKTDLPFTKDASSIEYSPDRPLLTLVTAQPIAETMDFYRQELGHRGWVLWSKKLNDKQPAGGVSGDIYERGASAQYISDKEPSVTLALTVQQTEGGKFKLELKPVPIAILASLHQAYLNGGTSNAPLVDVSTLPRPDSAVVEAGRSAPDRLSYSVVGPVDATIAAVRAMLLADGWQVYLAPMEQPRRLSLTLKKGGQGLRVSFTTPNGQPVRAGVDYSPARLPFALPFPQNATDVVFDENRPYLSLATVGAVEATSDFFAKALAAAGWSPLSGADVLKRWPNANLTGDGVGTLAYYISENQRPIVVSVQAAGNGKVNAEIKVPPFATAQTLEADSDVFGLPRPKQTKTSGGTGGDITREAHAHVLAEVPVVLAFYRREMTARGWTEQSQGAEINPNDVRLTFTSATGGTAVLKLAHKYDMTIVNLDQQLPKPPPRPATAAGSDSIDGLMKQAQQMMRDAGVDPAMMNPKGASKAPGAARPAAAETLRVRPGNETSVPLPDGADDIEVAGERLEFNIPASVASVANFYRTTMAQQGWRPQPSVINQANMAVVDFSKGRDRVSFTIMRMGDTTNVTASGSAIKTANAAPAKSNTPSAQGAVAAAKVEATEDDLIAEETGGLPIMKRRTSSEGTKTQYRRELKATTPLELTDVLGFYKREFGKLGWTEQSGAAVAADTAKVAYASTEGPAILTLGRKGNETTISVVIRNPDAAVKAGVMPKQGQARLLVSNPNDVGATITINNKTVNVAPRAGLKAPDGPVFDVPPGKYKYSIKLAGKPAQNDEVEVGADQAWGVLIGPGGGLALQVY